MDCLGIDADKDGSSMLSRPRQTVFATTWYYRQKKMRIVRMNRRNINDLRRKAEDLIWIAAFIVSNGTLGACLWDDVRHLRQGR
jgi:hypothetical protein